MNKKFLVFGITILILGVSIAPSLNAEIYKKNTEEARPFRKARDVKFEVIEFKSDGTIEKTIVELTIEESNEFKNKLKETNTYEEKLSLYKKYGLIPEDVTIEKLKKGMQEKAERYGLTEEKLSQITDNDFPILSDFEIFEINTMCAVIGLNIGTFRLILGLSTITRAVNAYLLYYSIICKLLKLEIFVPSIDLINSQMGFIGNIHAINGIFPDIDLDIMMFGILGMLCFVGFYIHGSDYWPLWFFPIFTVFELFFGYAAFFLVAGNEFTPYR